MYFVYILQSQKDKSHYTGVTEHLQKRIKEHNTKQAEYSSAKIPYVLRWFCAFPTKQRALSFERYLKSHSGIAFRNKRLV